jgi:hypothetical protein
MHATRNIKMSALAKLLSKRHYLDYYVNGSNRSYKNSPSVALGGGRERESGSGTTP